MTLFQRCLIYNIIIDIINNIILIKYFNNNYYTIYYYLVKIKNNYSIIYIFK